MAARSTVVTFHNWTDQDLTLTGEFLDHGEWTTGMSPPPAIGPNATVRFGSESAGFMTGTEGTVTYAIGGDGAAITLHYSNPFVGSNTHWLDLPGAGGAAAENWADLSGGEGDNAFMELTVLPSKLVLVPRFRPSINGFPFANSWPPDTTALTLDLGIVDLPIGDASNGLCGGMAYAAMDYFLAGLTVPQDLPKPIREGEPLFDYFVSRLVDSFDLPSLPISLMTLMDPLYPDTDDNILNPVGLANGRAFTMAREAWPQIKEWVDAGVTVPICLVKVKSLNPGEMGHNHQVLVWGYQVRGTWLTLWIYDPNHPGDDGRSITVNIGRTDQVAQVYLNPPPSAASSYPNVYCFIPTFYEKTAPPALPLPTPVP